MGMSSITWERDTGVSCLMVREEVMAEVEAGIGGEEAEAEEEVGVEAEIGDINMAMVGVVPRSQIITHLRSHSRTMILSTSRKLE